MYTFTVVGQISPRLKNYKILIIGHFAPDVYLSRIFGSPQISWDFWTKSAHRQNMTVSSIITL